MMSDKLPKQVTLVEVGPRDGLQNEKMTLNVADKLAFIDSLLEAGLNHIEVGSFVHPKKVPQMANSDELLRQLQGRRLNNPQVRFSVLCPNLKGLERAIDCGIDEVAIFASCSETFSQKNIGCSIPQAQQHFEQVIDLAKQHAIAVRGYLSCIIACPFEGPIANDIVTTQAKRLLELGCYQVSLGDTIGVASPGTLYPLLQNLLNDIPADNIAVHFHDTYGQALANILLALQFGISTIDASVAGLGGCPFAEAKKRNINSSINGNVATEDVLYLLNALNISSGVNLTKLIAAGNTICEKLNRETCSRVAQAVPL
jgi:hydroxymethylglutaryl-CoA lyase